MCIHIYIYMCIYIYIYIYTYKYTYTYSRFAVYGLQFPSCPSRRRRRRALSVRLSRRSVPLPHYPPTPTHPPPTIHYPPPTPAIHHHQHHPPPTLQSVTGLLLLRTGARKLVFGDGCAEHSNVYSPNLLVWTSPPPPAHL